MDDEIPPFSRGDKICGDFKVSKVIGDGGFGQVYLTEGLNGQKAVAVKIMLKKVSWKGVDVPDGDFFREVALARRCRHTNVLDISSFYLTAKEACTVMPVASTTLGDYVRTMGIKESLEFMAGVFRGLAHIHRQGVLHLDIKPENVLIVGGVPKVTDFGLARLYSRMGARISEEAVQSPDYRAPEVLEWELDEGASSYEVCPGTDVWSALEICDRILNGERALVPRMRRELFSIAFSRSQTGNSDPLPTMEDFHRVLATHGVSTYAVTNPVVSFETYSSDPDDHKFVDIVNYIYYQLAQPPFKRAHAEDVADVLERKLDPGELMRRGDVPRRRLPVPEMIWDLSAPRDPRENCLRKWFRKTNRLMDYHLRSNDINLHASRLMSKLTLDGRTSEDLALDAAACLTISVMLASGLLSPLEKFPDLGLDPNVVVRRIIEIIEDTDFLLV